MRSASVFLVVALTGPVAQAAVVYQQAPGWTIHPSYAAQDNNGRGFFDGFRLSSSATVDGASFVAAFAQTSSPPPAIPGIASLHIAIFDSAATPSANGNPAGNMLVSTAFATPVQARSIIPGPGTDPAFTGFTEYSMSFAPVVLAANTTYWFQINALFPDTPGLVYFPMASAAGLNSALRFDGTAFQWAPQNGNLAFALNGPSTAVSAPSTLALLGAAGLLSGLSRGRRTKAAAASRARPAARR